MPAPQSELAIVGLFRSRARIMCPGVSLVAIPNGGKRTQWAAMKAKREGMSAGFPDILAFWAGKGMAALEFKAAKGRISDNQSEWIDRLHGMGFPVGVFTDPDDALRFLKEAGAPFIGWFD